MKKNSFLRLAGLMLVMAMITTIALGGTLAKYRAEAVGQAAAKIAKFSVIVGEGTDHEVDIAIPDQTISIPLFETVLDTVDSQPDAHVSDGYIAPGTRGAFDLDIVNRSDVALDITVSILGPTGPDGAPNPYIEFLYKEFDGPGALWSPGGLAGGSGMPKITLLPGESISYNSNNIFDNTVLWRWQFERSVDANVAESALGVYAAANPETVWNATVTITATQVD